MAKPFNVTTLVNGRGKRYYLGRKVSDAVHGPRFKRPVIYLHHDGGGIFASCRWLPHHYGDNCAYYIDRLPDGTPCVLAHRWVQSTPCITPKGWAYGTFQDKPSLTEYGIEKWLRDWDRLAKE